MPVYSMTGYASVLGQPGANQGSAASQLGVELRSVNGRFLDLSMRLPEECRHLEGVLRERVSARIRRGKLELRLAWQGKPEGEWPEPPPDALARLALLQQQVTAALPSAQPLTVQEALQWCRATHTTSAAADEDWLALVDAGLNALLSARAREGERLQGLLMERIGTLRQLAARAEPLVPAVVARQQQRFLERWREALASAGSAISQEAAQERALHEAATQAIRLDVAEELGRLRTHLDEIERQLHRGGELGKRLDFLIQELHREANTLGSKSAALELTEIAVDMKVAIEQMREQIQNIE
ncbi:MAG: YicC family protein [Polaromonas sp.]|jgi:uncharacterized protein (TIGR00255 family)|nr:YicC family protein [Polaromonas sp.]